MYYFKKFFKFFGENRRAFFKYSSLSFIAGVLELFGIALTYPFVLKLLSKEEYKMSMLLGCVIVLLFILKNVFMIFYMRLQAKFTKNVEAEINLKFMKFFVSAPYQTTSKISFAEKANIMSFLIPNVINNYILRLLNISVNFFIFALISLFLAVNFPLATIVTVLCAVVLICVQNRFFKPKLNHIAKKSRDLALIFSRRGNETLLNLKGVKISHNESFFFDGYKKSILRFYKVCEETLFFNSIPPYVTEPFIILLLFVLLLIISVQNFTEPDKLVASFAVIVTAIFRIAPTISRIQVNLNGINSALPLVEELIKWCEAFDLSNVVIPEKKQFYVFKNTIELKDINYSYDGNKLALKNINMKINKGEFIGIAGLSGAGKSTLVDVITGLLIPESGEILVDGKCTDLPLKIGYIPQEYNVINASVRENVGFGQEDINDDAVIEALKKAQLYDFIKENYKDGIYANPFVDSSGFSQGQKQRLAIARALYLNPDIIILDEATSSLDLKTEDDICKVLISLKGEKTIIAVAHRLSTIKSADRIVYMKNAEISDIAAFDKLVTQNHEFAELVKLSSFK